MTIDLITMRQIVSNVFDEMLGLPTVDAELSQEPLKDNAIVASILISGSTNQLVVVEAQSTTAQYIAESMFNAEKGCLKHEEIRDAIGEVVNMIGGNVKGIYDGDSNLSLPCFSLEYSTKNLSFGSADSSEHIGIKVSEMPLFIHWHAMEPSVT